MRMPDLDYKVGMSTRELSRFFNAQMGTIDQDYWHSLNTGAWEKTVLHTLPDAVRDSVAPSFVKDYFYARLRLMESKCDLGIFIINYS